MPANSNRIGAIVGPARSGTTWAGTLIDSCPDVIYRFEPFHRLSRVQPRARDYLRRLKNQEITSADEAGMYALLRKAHPLTDKAPFFDNKSYRTRSFGKRQLWPLARALPGMQHVYAAAYTPPAGPPLVFKEVSFMAPLRNLLERTAIPIVYLVRHPCATVLSSLSGPGGLEMPPRAHQLPGILEANKPALAEQFQDVIRESDPVDRTALLWRFEVETCVELARRSPRGLVLTYEQLADDTTAVARRIFGHLGIEFTSSTEAFIGDLLKVSDGSGNVRRTGWGKRYFSIYRNPRDQKDSWRKRISPEDASKIERIVQGAPGIEFCAGIGKWW